MPGFFEALENFKPKERKPHVVTIEGLSKVVSIEEHREILKHGEENYMWQKGEIVRKPIAKPKIVHNVLTKSDKGYNFYDNDPYYPKDVVRGGFKWQQE
jgi:hypothetical protein|tara:strand:- start:729 stop:1025 length:297 start_codon:yes stop_codon:yes gene_type:complete